MSKLKDSKTGAESIVDPIILRAVCNAFGELIKEHIGRDLTFMIIVVSDTPDRATALMGNGETETLLNMLRELGLSEKAILNVDKG